MSVTIRQEINILDAILSAAGGSSATANELVQLDTTKYNNPSYYFEVVADSTVSISFAVILYHGAFTEVTRCTIPLLTTSYKRVRSAAFTPPAGVDDYGIQIDATAGATKNVKTARIIIIDNPSTLAVMETQIEVGSNATSTSTSLAAIANPKYWLYTAANWNGTPQFFFEAVFKTTNSKATATVQLQQDDGSFANWTNVTNGSVTSTQANQIVRVRTSSAFTPVTGRHYRVAVSTGNSKSAMSIYCAKIIVQQTNPTLLEPQYLLLNTADAGTGLQTYQTLIDLTEWSAVTNTYKHAIDSDNASNSAKLQDIDNGNADITSSTVTGSNQQISADLAANFTSGHQVDVNVTNSTGTVAASRILVGVTLASETITPDKWLLPTNQPVREIDRVVSY